MATIDLRIQRIEQPLDSLNPAPFHENALGSDAEEYIVDYAGEYGRTEPLRLIVHAPVSIKQQAAEITRAIHAHSHAQCRRRYQGGCGSVATCWSRELPSLEPPSSCALYWDPGDRAMIVAIGEGLLILGWVAMWRPLEILLFERLENHQNSALLHRRAQIPVDFEFDVTEPYQSETSGRTTGRRDRLSER